jgi:hypothetical protein
VLSLGVVNANYIQQPFKLSWLGLVLLVATRTLYVGHGTVWLPLLVVAFRGAGLIWVTQLLMLLGVFVIVGRLFGQCILFGDGKHLLRRPGVLHGELADQGWVLESLLEEYDVGFVVDLRDDVPFVPEMLDKFMQGLSLLLYDAGQS